MISEKEITAAPRSEVNGIVRNLIIWLNKYPDLPVDFIYIEPMLYEAPGMTLITVSSNITNPYIYGAHKADLQFGLVYRIKPGTSPNKRLEARELLESMGEWAENNAHNLDLGDGIRTVKIASNPEAQFLTPYENGDEDYQILMKLTYEVI